MNFWKILLLITCLGVKSAYSDSAAHWIDIPSADYKTILAMEEVEVDYLNQCVTQYHSIDKNSPETQQDRIESLDKIGKYLEFLAAQERFVSKKSTLLLLNQSVQYKKEYLKKLLEIPPDNTIEFYHLDDSPLLDTAYTPIFLRNNRSYSLKMREFWGAFWLESIDPCHRRLANYYQFWLDTHPTSKNYQSFFLWLESHPIPTNIPIVEYYSDKQLESCRIEFIDGYLRKSDTHELVHTDPTKRNLFVIDLSKKLYLEMYKEGVWHTSLSRGKPVLGAGLLQIEQGTIQLIAFESGHYLPSIEQSFQSLQIFLEKGARFRENFEVVYFENRNKYKSLLTEDTSKQYQIFNEAIHKNRELLSSNEF